MLGHNINNFVKLNIHIYQNVDDKQAWFYTSTAATYQIRRRAGGWLAQDERVEGGGWRRWRRWGKGEGGAQICLKGAVKMYIIKLHGAENK